MKNAISNMGDTIDSRDIIDHIAELEDTRDSLQTAYDDAVFDNQDNEELAAMITARDELDAWNNSGEAEELRILNALQDEAAGYSPDWTYGSQLIRESYFEQAMDEMIEECYELPKDLPFWMTISYDYDALKQDYTEVDFDGVTYYVR